MARKIKKFEIKDGRDNGKLFLLTEMPARDGHRWATKALFAIMNGGVEIPDNILDSGFAGMAAVGIRALGNINIDVAEPLLDELLQCVAVIPDPHKPEVTRPIHETDIEEVTTFFKLQKEILSLHLDFSTADVK